jgi:alanyl-tRNA synthetase
VRYGRQIGIDKTGWTKTLVPIVKDIYANIYPELERNGDFISSELEKEENKFAKTLEKGLRLLDRGSMRVFDKIPEKIPDFSTIEGMPGFVPLKITGEWIFDLYQTFGFPYEMAIEELEKRGHKFHESDINRIEKEFNGAINKHQELSRTASAGMFKGGLADSSEATTKLHTAAHLALAALREVLGDHVTQKGSNITSERLRFDFSHHTKMTNEEISEVEHRINDWIETASSVTMKEMSVDEAKREGAMGVFSDRYGEKVKVYSIGDNGSISKEICGGPHVANIGDLGKFKIIKEESASAGIRRIKAVLE